MVLSESGRAAGEGTAARPGRQPLGSGEAMEGDRLPTLGFDQRASDQPTALGFHQRYERFDWQRWESNSQISETLSEPDTFTEYTLDSEDTSVSSTRASTSATGTTGSVPRRAVRALSAVVRGGRSPSLLHGAPPGYRGRSVTRRERHVPGAALRHRRPTHTPNGRRGMTPPRTLSGPRLQRLQSHSAMAGSTFAGFLAHEITRVGEEQVEGVT